MQAPDGTWAVSYTHLDVYKRQLLNSEYHVEFKLDGYADGTNEKPVKDLTVTDNSIGLQYIEKINDGAEAYRDLTLSLIHI